MRISTVATFVLAISVAIVTAIPMKKEENTEVDRSGPALSDVAAMADQAIDVRKRFGCSRYTQLWSEQSLLLWLGLHQGPL